jgi:hypothetical protein
MPASRSRRTEALLFAGVVAGAVVVLVVVALALRSQGSGMGPTDGGTVTSTAASTASSQPVAAATGKPQICASCWGDGGPDPTVTGSPEVMDGVQIVNVGLDGGYYVPNEFTVQAGSPVTVVFTGSAEGCLAEPEFPELGLTGDMRSGSATFDLGVLDPGTYAFTCSMGVNEGHITVE